MAKREKRAGWTLQRTFWFGGGSLALGFGGIGAVLPVLPTTPFIILAAFCFGKSAPGIARRLEDSRTFGPMIRDWRAEGAIALRFKVIALLMMAAVIGVSLVTGVSKMILFIQIICVIAAATFILSRPS